MANEFFKAPRLFKATQPSGSEDALELFGSEPASVAAEAAADAVAETAVDAVVDSPADSNNAISLESVLAVAPLRFVDGVALVQALSAAVKAKGGINAGMPALSGTFLAASGDVVTFSPPTGQPAAQELARLLHRLVPTDATPPMGRLFVDRWTNGNSTDLAQFESELAYFARPNGRELLTAVHGRSVGTAARSSLPTPTSPMATTPTNTQVRHPADNETRKEPPARKESPWLLWLRSHRRQIAAAVLVVTTSVVLTGVVTWFWPAKTAEAAQPAAQAQAVDEAVNANELVPDKTATRTVPPKAPAQRGVRPLAPSRAPGRPEGQRAEAPPPPPPPPAAPASRKALDEVPPANLPSSSLPDMRIYSAADSGVEPPKLLSTEIAEALIAGFPTRTNSVEAIISGRGEVERVRMLGPPQRIPDVMLLSRMKEWMFAPATKDGTAVRYRMILSWDVTP